jgi:predicted outer membrane repeat protein
VEGVPGDRCYLFVSRRPGFLLAKPLGGLWCVPAPLFMAIAPIGVVPASGTLVVQLSAFDLRAPAVDEMLYLQGLCIDTAGQSFLTSCTHVDVFDRAGLPDCDGDQINDFVELFEGLAADCNANVVDDACEIAAGALPDCNGNGVPDVCDIAGGAPDLNHNGIPDVCEPSGLSWYVDDSAAPGGNGSISAPYQTLGAAFQVALPSDSILVADGLYIGSSNRNLSFGGRDLVVRSLNGASNCIIDLQGTGAAFSLSQNETSASRIEGFTIRNGSSFAGRAINLYRTHAWVVGCRFEACTSTLGRGTAVFMRESTSRIEDCTFVQCHAREGGALGFELGSPTVVGCTFENNTGSYGGALFGATSPQGRMVLSHCTFLGNTSDSIGGAIYFTGQSNDQVLIENCLFAGNSSVNGGAVSGQSDVTISDCTFAFNSASSQGGALHRYLGGTGELLDSVLWGNQAPSGPQIAVLSSASGQLLVAYSCIEGGQALVQSGAPNTVTWGAGNIDVNPLFADQDGPDNNPLTFGDNDYRLAIASPCIDAADNALIAIDLADIDGDGNFNERVPLDRDLLPRRQDIPSAPNSGAGTPPIVDMGCYERQP